jgi:hypothetical protein
MILWTATAEQAVEHSTSDQKYMSSILGTRWHSKEIQRKKWKIITSTDIEIKWSSDYAKFFTVFVNKYIL